MIIPRCIHVAATTFILFYSWVIFHYGLPCGSVVKNPIANAGDAASIPGSGWSPGKGDGNLLQYSCLRNLMDRRAWRAIVHGAKKESGTTYPNHHHHHQHQHHHSLLFLLLHFNHPGVRAVEFPVVLISWRSPMTNSLAHFSRVSCSLGIFPFEKCGVDLLKNVRHYWLNPCSRPCCYEFPNNSKLGGREKKKQTLQNRGSLSCPLPLPRAACTRQWRMTFIIPNPKF